MEATKMEELRSALIRRRGDIQTEVDRLSEELQWLGTDQETERGALGNHLAEDGSNVQEQSRITTVSEDLRGLLQQIDSALQRLDGDTFGICERCAKPIDAERLEAFPYVRFCIGCQTYLERQRTLYGAI